MEPYIKHIDVGFLNIEDGVGQQPCAATGPASTDCVAKNQPISADCAAN